MALNPFFQLPVQSIIYSGTGLGYIFLTIRLPEQCCWYWEALSLLAGWAQWVFLHYGWACSAPPAPLPFHEHIPCSRRAQHSIRNSHRATPVPLWVPLFPRCHRTWAVCLILECLNRNPGCLQSLFPFRACQTLTQHLRVEELRCQPRALAAGLCSSSTRSLLCLHPPLLPELLQPLPGSILACRSPSPALCS